MENICEIDCCSKCELRPSCKGCMTTGGHPFGGDCVLASCCDNKECRDAFKRISNYKAKLIEEFNLLKIEDMPEVTDLYALNGSFINLEYSLKTGNKIKFWNDNDVYLGNQLKKNNSNRCYGLTANNDYLLVCEYGENGDNPEVIIYKKRG